MVSRTFTLSIKQLPRIVRDSIALAYLLLRVSDCLEDHESMEVDRKVRLLELWDQILEGHRPAAELVEQLTDLDSADPEVYVAQKASDLIAFLKTFPQDLQKSIISRVGRTTLGMARWQKQGPYVETEADMDDYMHQVAGRVGYLITDIFAWYSPRIRRRKEELMPLSREYGLALQTVNIIRGMRKDYERGWVFVPRTYLDQVGVTREQLFAPGYEDKAIEVVNMLADKAERHLRHGLEYIAVFPMHQHRIRLACMWPLFFAVKTLALSRNNINVVLTEVKMTRRDVKTIMRQTTLMGWSNKWLDRYYETLSQGR
jgi:farnesyl-diphosphate farnesyltransferase